MAVEDKDMGFDAAMKGIQDFAKSKVKIGLLSTTDQEVIDRGVWNEFGTGSIPARPFMRSAFDENQMAISEIISSSLLKSMDGGDAMLETIGMSIKEMIEKRIDSSPEWAVPNAPLTIALKGSAHPLIDTGEMRDSISFVVEKDGES